MIGWKGGKEGRGKVTLVGIRIIEEIVNAQALNQHIAMHLELLQNEEKWRTEFEKSFDEVIANHRKKRPGKIHRRQPNRVTKCISTKSKYPKA